VAWILGDSLDSCWQELDTVVATDTKLYQPWHDEDKIVVRLQNLMLEILHHSLYLHTENEQHCVRDLQMQSKKLKKGIQQTCNS
jgi:hypothetical protein